MVSGGLASVFAVELTTGRALPAPTATTTRSVPSWLAIAQERAGQRAGTTFGNDSTVLVGDTPNDVKAGLEAGVRVIGVATGKTSLAELREAGAAWAIDAVAHVGALVGALVPD
jgi:phosphoglycolate phosphatase-like HAD superfamily hydrolase